MVTPLGPISHTIWLTWWMGDLAGALVVTPVIALWSTSSIPISSKRRETLELAGVVILSIAVGLIAFSPLLRANYLPRRLAFLVILPLMWSALRGGQRDMATVAFVVSCFAVWGAVLNGGPFARGNLNGSLPSSSRLHDQHLCAFPGIERRRDSAQAS